MRKTILLAALLLGMTASARAQQQVAVVNSSATYTTVTLSTSAATRVDDLSTGGVHVALPSRTEILGQALLGGTTLWCGYDSSVSSQTTSVNQGECFPPGSKFNKSMSTALKWYCLPESGTPPRLHLQQARNAP